MLNINITNFRKNVYEILEQVIKYSKPVNVSTELGNAVIISEDKYNELMETLYLSSISEVKEKIIEGMNTPIEECIPENNELNTVTIAAVKEADKISREPNTKRYSNFSEIVAEVKKNI